MIISLWTVRFTFSFCICAKSEQRKYKSACGSALLHQTTPSVRLVVTRHSLNNKAKSTCTFENSISCSGTYKYNIIFWYGICLRLFIIPTLLRLVLCCRFINITHCRFWSRPGARPLSHFKCSKSNGTAGNTV